MKQITIGLFGFGVVGEGIYKLLEQAPQLNTRVKKVCIKDPSKERNAPSNLFTTNENDILNDPEINVVVELITEADAALNIINRAFENGKHVVSANKKVIAENLLDLINKAAEKQVSFLYEASSCASIPIIRNLEEYFDNDWLRGFYGIVNGSTNFILTQINNEGLSYPKALQLAAENGFAEADPSLDVEGFDAAYKLSILTYHAFGVAVNPYDVFRIGITKILPEDAIYAKQNESRIKLVAAAIGDDKKDLLVCPAIVPRTESIANTNNEYNAVTVQSAFATEQLFYGKGAGRFPTASAVLSDISALSYNYRYGYKKAKRQETISLQANQKFKWFVSSKNKSDIENLNVDSIQSYYTKGYAYRIFESSIEEIKQLHQNNSELSILLVWETQS